MVTAARPAAVVAEGIGHIVAAVSGRRRARGPHHSAEVDPTKAAAVRHYAAMARQAAALRALRESPRRPRVLPVDRLEPAQEDGLDG